MNPFTESTVAQPLSDLPPRAGNNDPTAVDTPHQDAKLGTDGVSKDVKPAHKPARYPRSGRLVRRRARGSIARRTISAAWPTYCRQAARAVLGLVLTFALPGAWAVNVNNATVQQLESITGIGPKTAQVIIDERARGGSFDSFDDLVERVKGIGAKKARSLQAAGLSVGQADSANTKPSVPTTRKSGR